MALSSTNVLTASLLIQAVIVTSAGIITISYPQVWANIFNNHGNASLTDGEHDMLLFIGIFVSAFGTMDFAFAFYKFFKTERSACCTRLFCMKKMDLTYFPDGRREFLIITGFCRVIIAPVMWFIFLSIPSFMKTTLMKNMAITLLCFDLILGMFALVCARISMGKETEDDVISKDKLEFIVI